MHVYSHMDPMDTIWTKGVHVYGHLKSGRKSDQQRRPRGGRRNAVVLCGALLLVTPFLLPARRLLVCTAQRRVEGLRWRMTRRGAPPPPTADVADFEVAARGEKSMPKIPDASDEIEVLCAAKRSWEERQL